MPVTLTGTAVELRPLRTEDAPALLAAAADGELWNLTVTVVPNADTVDRYIATALEWAAAGTAMPFVIVDRATDRVVGCTRYWRIDRVNRCVEIGHTWLSQSAQRTRINTEAKYLLLTHAFEAMACIRVQFTTDELNEKSRAAILRLGAVQEGIIRNERIMPNGRIRNAYFFSILDTEWPAVKRNLEAKLSGTTNPPVGESR